MKNPKENLYPFVEGATYADEVREIGVDYQGIWHYVTNPYFNQGGKPEDYGDYGANPHNITYVLPEIIDWLMERNNY